MAADSVQNTQKMNAVDGVGETLKVIGNKDHDQSDFESEMMCIIVTNEEESRKYYAHKHILQRRSPYFAALTEFREGKENLVTLRNMNHNAFRQVIHWMYTNQFQSSLCTLRVIMQTWVAADRLMMSQCKNMAMDELRSLSRMESQNVVGLLEMEELGLTTDSTMVKYCLDQILWDAIYSDTWDNVLTGIFTAPWKSIETAQYLSLKAVSVARELDRAHRATHLHPADPARKGKQPQPIDPALLKGCKYHDHTEGERCYLDNREGNKEWIK